MKEQGLGLHAEPTVYVLQPLPPGDGRGELRASPWGPQRGCCAEMPFVAPTLRVAREGQTLGPCWTSPILGVDM